jgi:hypothetical protein
MQLEKTSSIHIKKSVVKPIYKKRTKEDVNSYRPVTLVEALSKILEKVVGNQVITLLHKLNISNKFQFGFTKYI